MSNKNKRVPVTVGDLVMLHSNAQHITGNTGVVTHVIDRDLFIWKAVATNDVDYYGTLWTASTRKPSGRTKGNASKEDYRTWIRKVIHHAHPQAPKPAKPAKPVKVIKTKADLRAALTEPSKGHRLVVDLKPDPLPLEAVQRSVELRHYLVTWGVDAQRVAALNDDEIEPLYDLLVAASEEEIALSDEERALRDVEVTDGR